MQKGILQGFPRSVFEKPLQSLVSLQESKNKKEMGIRLLYIKFSTPNESFIAYLSHQIK
jgi:hypothetical protein